MPEIPAPPRADQRAAPDRPSRPRPSRPRPSREAPPTGFARTRLVLVLGLLITLGPLTIDMYLPALPDIGADLGVAGPVVQLTLTGTLAGLALGQLVVGPLSDSLGRRRPLMVGIAVHIAASVVCAFAPDVAVLGIARCVQGMGAAATMVVTVAVIGDLYSGRDAASLLSRLMLVLGVAPVVAPSLGAAVLLHGSWQWVFAGLVVVAALLLVLAACALGETLPPTARRPLRVGPILSTYGRLLRDVPFLVLVAVGSLGMAGLFAYIAGGAFVLQGRFGLDEQAFALVFGAGAVAFIGATQLNVVLLRQVAPLRIMLGALIVGFVAGVVFLVLAFGDLGGMPGLLVPVWVMLAAVGLVIPNAPAVALSRHDDAAGTAAALLGAGQFGLGAIVAPLVGVLGNDAAAVALVMAVSMAVALVGLLAVRRTFAAAAPGDPA